MTTGQLLRRHFLAMVGAVAAAGFGRQRESQPLDEELRAFLELSGAERDWLTGVSDAHLTEITDGIRATAGPERDRAAQLLANILGPRARVCAYSRYPASGLDRAACNGLFRE
jgi:hypothetical protein